MIYTRDDYWQESFECAMEEAGAGDLLRQLTKEQREEIGGALAGADENRSMAFPTPESPLRADNSRLERRLKWEREREGCPQCKGRGRLITYGPYHSADSECWKCRGDGKVHPRGEREPA